jgi:hypothetical protein
LVFDGCDRALIASQILGTGQPVKPCQKKIPGCAVRRRVEKEEVMDITTLLIIIVVVLLLGGGGWYGRGRWY